MIYAAPSTGGTFVVSSPGAGQGEITLNGWMPVYTGAVNMLRLGGTSSGISATVHASATLPYSGGITIYGDAGSTAILDGDGSSAVMVGAFGDAAQAYTAQVSATDLGTVDVVGPTNIQVNNSGGANNNVAIDGWAGVNNYDVTPTGTSTATITDNGLAATLYTNNTGTLTVDGGAGNVNSVTVEGTAGADTITVTNGATTTVQVGAWQTVSVPTAHTASLVVDGDGGADTFDVTGSNGPTLTINGSSTDPGTLNFTDTHSGTTSFYAGTTSDSGQIDTPDGVTTGFAGIDDVSPDRQRSGLQQHLRRRHERPDHAGGIQRHNRRTRLRRSRSSTSPNTAWSIWAISARATAISSTSRRLDSTARA